MERFDPPGFLDDFTAAEREHWSTKVSGWFDEVMNGNPQANDGPRLQFFNPLRSPPGADAQVLVISWNAFPRQVKSSSLSDKQRWRRADSDRNLQDEYCEWSVSREATTGKIVRVTFTCEGPEYWEELAKLNPAKVLALYQQFVSPAVRKEDLFPDDGPYDPENRFNRSTTLGAMHLIQDANTLTAEIELAAAATIVRIKNGQEVTSAQELIVCSRYGAPGRNSDPHIGEQVNALARQRADITLNNPVGLYFHDFNPVGWVTPDGVDPRTFWKYVRGKDNHFVRAVFEVPASQGYVVGDIKISGRPIEFGAQIADFVTIKLEGLATRVGQSNVAPFNGCRGVAQPPAALEAAPVGRPLRSRLRDDQVFAVGAAPPEGPALTGAEQALLARLPQTLSKYAPVEALAAAPPALRPYPKLPAEKLKTRLVSGKLMAYASPDSTYSITKRLLDSAQESIVIGIYDFHADYVKEDLKRAMRRGVSVSLMLDTNLDEEADLFDELSELGAECVRAPSSSAGHEQPLFNNAHEKIIVIDKEIVMIQSGNWSENSIPQNEGDGVLVGSFEPGNRDMGIAVHSPALATFFAELVARDMRLAQGLPPDAAPPDAVAPPAGAAPVARAPQIFFEAAPPAVPLQLFPSLTVTPASPVPVTPVVTPENFHGVAMELLRSAKRSIRIEQQYIRGGQEAVEALLQEIDVVRNENPDLDVRIIVSPKYLTGANRQRFLQAMRDYRFEFDDHFRFLAGRFFVHCHNKLIIVDDETVLLGSQNWSTTGLLTNREASLLVEHAGIASYFASIFDADWNMSEPSGGPPEAVLGLDPENILDGADFARGGAVISSVRDYTDV